MLYRTRTVQDHYCGVLSQCTGYHCCIWCYWQRMSLKVNLGARVLRYCAGDICQRQDMASRDRPLRDGRSWEALGRKQEWSDIQEDRRILCSQGTFPPLPTWLATLTYIIPTQEFADSIGVPFMEASAKDSINVEQAFITMTKLIKEKYVKRYQTSF